MSDSNASFLGRGWAFPPKFTVENATNGDQEGHVEMTSGEADIEESLRVLMSTRRGERIMRPRYGLGVWSHVFDTMDNTTLADLQSQIEDAILHWEPRIRVEDVSFDTSQAHDGILNIHLTYRIPAINSRSNMVFPFYMREGTNVRGPDDRGLGTT